jgi:hypothetical protein
MNTGQDRQAVPVYNLIFLQFSHNIYRHNGRRKTTLIPTLVEKK